MIKLPTSKVPASSKSPNKLFLFGSPKIGKTTLFSELENALILDFENGTAFLDAVKVNIISISVPKETEIEKKNRYEKGQYALSEVIAELKKNCSYKYLIIDTITKLEDMCLDLALAMYRETPLGKNFKDENILVLPKGGGYQWLRLAVDKVTKAIEALPCRIIYIGHIKTSSLEKDGKELAVADIDLTGKIKSMMSANADAIGLMRRVANKGFISFVTSDDAIVGARCEHLRNKEILISEYKDGKLFVYWDKVFID